MTDPAFRARLTLRVKTRLVAQGLSNEAANRTALAAVANYYEGQVDRYFHDVTTDAVSFKANVSSPLSGTFAGALAVLASHVEAMSLFGSASRSLGCIAHGGPDCVCDDLDREFHVKDYATPPERLDDFIDGGPDHHQLCETWNDPAWPHKSTLCTMTRVQCQHHPKHRYGQKCDAYQPGADYFEAENELSEEYGDNLPTSAAAPFLSVVPSQPTPADRESAFLHAPDCIDQGKHLRGDCHKPRATCSHTPVHLYSEECPK